MCFVLCVDFSDSAITIADRLSSYTLHMTDVRTCSMPGMWYEISFSSRKVGITVRMAVDNAMYSASEVESAMVVCSVERQSTGHPTYSKV